MAATNDACEPFKPICCPTWWTEALYETVHRSPVKAAQIAESVGCSADYLYALATAHDNQSLKHRHIRPNLLAPLMRASGNVTLLGALAHQVGHQIAPLQSPRTTEPLPHVAARYLQIAGNLVEAIAGALADGVVSSAEGKALRAKLKAMVEHGHRLDMAITMREAAEG